MRRRKSNHLQDLYSLLKALDEAVDRHGNSLNELTTQSEKAMSCLDEEFKDFRITALKRLARVSNLRFSSLIMELLEAYRHVRIFSAEDFMKYDGKIALHGGILDVKFLHRFAPTQEASGSRRNGNSKRHPIADKFSNSAKEAIVLCFLAFCAFSATVLGWLGSGDRDKSFHEILKLYTSPSFGSQEFFEVHNESNSSAYGRRIGWDTATKVLNGGATNVVKTFDTRSLSAGPPNSSSPPKKRRRVIKAASIGRESILQHYPQWCRDVILSTLQQGLDLYHDREIGGTPEEMSQMALDCFHAMLEKQLTLILVDDEREDAQNAFQQSVLNIFSDTSNQADKVMTGAEEASIRTEQGDDECSPNANNLERDVNESLENADTERGDNARKTTCDAYITAALFHRARNSAQAAQKTAKGGPSVPSPRSEPKTRSTSSPGAQDGEEPPSEVQPNHVQLTSLQSVPPQPIESSHEGAQQESAGQPSQPSQIRAARLARRDDEHRVLSQKTLEQRAVLNEVLFFDPAELAFRDFWTEQLLVDEGDSIVDAWRRLHLSNCKAVDSQKRTDYVTLMKNVEWLQFRASLQQEFFRHWKWFRDRPFGTQGQTESDMMHGHIAYHLERDVRSKGHQFLRTRVVDPSASPRLGKDLVHVTRVIAASHSISKRARNECKSGCLALVRLFAFKHDKQERGQHPNVVISDIDLDVTVPGDMKTKYLLAHVCITRESSRWCDEKELENIANDMAVEADILDPDHESQEGSFAKLDVTFSARLYEITELCSLFFPPRMNGVLDIYPLFSISPRVRQLICFIRISELPTEIEQVLLSMPALNAKAPLSGPDRVIDDPDLHIDTSCKTFLQSQILSKNRLDESQAKAVKLVLGKIKQLESDTGSITLIQGPPGTGKTSTILSLISCLLQHSASAGKNQARPQQNTSTPETIPWSGGPRILVLVHTNSCVDDLVERLHVGLTGPNGQLYRPKMTRLAKADYEPESSTVKQYLLKEQVLALHRERNPEPSAQAKIFQTTLEHTRECAIVLSTVAISSSQTLSRLGLTFDLTIIDESTKCFEGELVCALQNAGFHNEYVHMQTVQANTGQSSGAMNPNCDQAQLRVGQKRKKPFHVVLVGDHRQLGPMEMIPALIKDYASDPRFRDLIPILYDFGRQSLFERLIIRGECDSVMLRFQYRSHPGLSRVHSNIFYNGMVKDGLPQRAFERRYNVERCRALFWLDTSNFKGRYESKGALKSYSNKLEGKLIMKMLDVNLRSSLWQGASICILTPYTGQQSYLKGLMNQTCSTVEVSTVDAMQGKERDIIILSTVRSGRNGNLGFLRDIRRMNVALSRAKYSLIIVGDCSTLTSESTWKTYFDECASETSQHSWLEHSEGCWPLSSIFNRNIPSLGSFSVPSGPGAYRGGPNNEEAIGSPFLELKGKNQTYCTLCNASISGQPNGAAASSHLRGRKHQTNVRQKAISERSRIAFELHARNERQGK